MKRLITFSVVAAAAAVPAVFGLAGNASFAQTVPVRVPAQAQLVDDRGGQSTHIEPGDDNDGSSASEPGDDKGGQSTHFEPGDDKGGSSASEPGDDNGGSSSSSSSEPGDDNGGSSGHGEEDGSGHP